MRLVMFYHSLISDWNHGNAHFLRGLVSELLYRGHDVRVYEPADSWSRKNLCAEYGEETGKQLLSVYPWLRSVRYDIEELDLEEALDGADIVMVHEWNERELVKKVGDYKIRAGGFTLFFHDTHHRSITEPEEMEAYDLSGYDGVLAFGEVLRDIYLNNGWAHKAWTWHEAADVRVFYPRRGSVCEGDLVWIGNWGDGERTSELNEFLIEPVKSLGLKARVHGVRYPERALKSLDEAGVEYAGWLPNYAVPQALSMFKCTVHVPRRPYAAALPGIPTIRVFEALACGIPLVSAPWEDSEGLFTKDKDFLTAKTGADMKRLLNSVVYDSSMRKELSASGRAAILTRHTCAHRVEELMNIYREVNKTAKGAFNEARA